MAALVYNIPHRAGIRCMNPVCDEYANVKLTPTAAGVPRGPFYYCTEHVPQTFAGTTEKLRVAGEPNSPPPESPNEPA